jgi:hypothetical protein
LEGSRFGACLRTSRNSFYREADLKTLQQAAPGNNPACEINLECQGAGNYGPGLGRAMPLGFEDEDEDEDEDEHDLTPHGSQANHREDSP